ncbi:hypothetical protein T05_7641 [Trichinella murrelli]|uniref:Uncharacterized protein n=1 Tax=Trichinella murrelli TaxID=144512 RepID=A0A0V0TF29_9BILA|nr:hypothetical protein T05_7641 [Trichinella murrelli]
MISTRSRSFAEFSKSDKFRDPSTHCSFVLEKVDHACRYNFTYAMCNKIFCMLCDIHYFGTKDFSDKQFADKC